MLVFLQFKQWGLRVNGTPWEGTQCQFRSQEQCGPVFQTQLSSCKEAKQRPHGSFPSILENKGLIFHSCMHFIMHARGHMWGLPPLLPEEFWKFCCGLSQFFSVVRAPALGSLVGFWSLAHFSTELFIFSLLGFKSVLLCWVTILYQGCLLQIFSSSLWPVSSSSSHCLLQSRHFLILMKPSFLVISLMDHIFVLSQKPSPYWSNLCNLCYLCYLEFYSFVFYLLVHDPFQISFCEGCKFDGQ